MDPLEQKKALREHFLRNRGLKNKKQKEILTFKEYGIEVDGELLRAYREERGGADS